MRSHCAAFLISLWLCGGASQLVGTVMTLAGGDGGIFSGSNDGIGTLARFNSPNAVAIDPLGNFALVY